MRNRYLLTSVLMLVITATLGVPRTAANSYTVTNTNDDGDNSLRWAIMQANGSPGLDEIDFNIPAGPYTIAVGGGLPEIVDPVIIDGSTQPDYSGSPLIELDGTNAGATDGLVIGSAGGGSTVRGLMINRFAGNGIRLEGTSGNVIEGNIIGTNTSGGEGIGNSGNGIWVFNSSGNTIGGTAAVARNVISGNTGDGVSIWDNLSTDNTVIGNFIGITPDGLTALGNGGGSGENLGIRVGAGASNNFIGGSTSSEANVISGNLKGGVSIDNGAFHNTVIGNLVGTNPAGDAAIANGDKGLIIQSDANDNTIQANVISGNNGEGVVIYNGYNNIVRGNFIGTDASGNAPVPNIRAGVAVDAGGALGGNNVIGGTSSEDRNVISGNGLEGIFLAEGTEQNLVLGNYIGTNAGGNAALSNGGIGVHIWRSPSNTIGGTEAGARNVISGNADGGIVIQELVAHDNVVQGNYIGTNATGDAPLSNANVGVYISGSPNNTIGGANPGARNVISGNAVAGMIIQDPEAHDNTVQGNYIGTDASGTQAIPNSSGITIDGSGTNTIGDNVISGNTGTAVTLYTSEGNKILNNCIGTDKIGSTALPNTDDGVDIAGGTNATVKGNVISGNSSTGIVIRGSETTGNLVQGNMVGTDKDGTASIGNGEGGIAITEAHDNTIGGSTPEARNIISGNAQDGISIAVNGTTGNRVHGNSIGTDVSGTLNLGNSWDGVFIGNGAFGNLIGGTEQGAGNIIAFNGAGGVVTESEAGTGNAVRANSIYSNSGLGIDLAGDWITSNDAGDVDTGPNNLQNYPILTSAVSGSTTIHGTFNSAANTTFSIDFFSNTQSDPSGYGEGQTVIGSTTLTTDNGGNAPIHVSFPTTAEVGDFITATATDPSGNTSEFSNAVQVTQAQLVLYFLGGAVSGSKYVFDVNVVANEVLKMGNTSLVFSHNALGLSGNTTLLPQAFSGGSYSEMELTDVESGKKSINIGLASPDNGTTIGNTYPGTKVCTIEMDIIDPSQNASLTWDLANTSIHADDNTTLLTVTSGASDDTPLPIQVASMTASTTDRGVCLEWTTASETNNYGFEAYRRDRGAKSITGAFTSKRVDTKWTKVGFVAGHGTTLQPQSYSFTDAPTKAGYYEYRIKQIDLDGKSTYIGTLQVDAGIPRTFTLYQNYPNPFNPTTTIGYALPKQSYVTLKVYDMLGRVVQTLVDERQQSGLYEAHLNASGLASGVYFYRLQAGNFNQTRNLLLLR